MAGGRVLAFPLLPATILIFQERTLNSKTIKLIRNTAKALAEAATLQDAKISVVLAAKLTGGYRIEYVRKKASRIESLLRDAWEKANEARKSELRVFWQAIVNDDPDVAIKVETEGGEIVVPKTKGVDVNRLS